MVINEKTRLREMQTIAPFASLAGVDLLDKCSKFNMPTSIRGIKPMPFYNVSMQNLAWIWDIKDAQDLMIAICEIFFYSQLPKWRKLINNDSAKWAERWLLDAPLIDFYRFAYQVSDDAMNAADQFSKIQIKLTEEERAAGYGHTDPDSVKKMIDAFARRQGISSMDDAANYAWVHYLFVFKNDADEQNRQRKYNEILANKNKKR